jgi:murein DD-endopeptidase MepM/ murein hydrolase activator NlpD
MVESGLNIMNETGSAPEQPARPSWRERLLARLFPGLKRGNEPDMPMITHDRLWFLRENRFLFFTRGGPVEVTLRPSYVLAAVIVGMAGIATIFYSTMIASYSAIEVIRDETIQTAEASIGAARPNRAGDPSAENWTQSIANPRANAGALDHFGLVDGKTAIETKPLVSRLTSRPDVRAPQSADIAPGAHTPDGPIIIQGGKRIVPESARKATRIATDNATATATDTDTATANPNATAALTAEPTSTQASVASSPIASSSSEPSPIAPSPGRLSTSIDSLAVRPADIQTGAEEAATSPGLITRARDLTVAMLPSFLRGNTPPASETPPTNMANMALRTPQPPLSNGPMAGNSQFDNSQILPENDTAIDQMADQPEKQATIGARPPQLAPGASGSGPTLPFVSEAARARKLELSAHDEINFIRATVTDLGVAVTGLPPVAGLDTTNNDDSAFKDLMISLAEHRAALRKIPFKSPMHYFYVTSPYGKRKHPKTGKFTFHHGLDLAGAWQENARSTAPGTVIFAGVEGSFGKVVRVQHDYDIVTTYAHLARITVKRGDYVGENSVIGKMGSTGKTAGIHLHYEIRVNGTSVNPERFMDIGRQISVGGELRQTAAN